MTRSLYVFLIAAALTSSGCTSLACASDSVSSAPNQPFQGTALCWSYLSGSLHRVRKAEPIGIGLVLPFALDLPLCVVADTLMAPFFLLNKAQGEVQAQVKDPR